MAEFEFLIVCGMLLLISPLESSPTSALDDDPTHHCDNEPEDYKNCEVLMIAEVVSVSETAMIVQNVEYLQDTECPRPSQTDSNDATVEFRVNWNEMKCGYKAKSIVFKRSYLFCSHKDKWNQHCRLSTATPPVLIPSLSFDRDVDFERIKRQTSSIVSECCEMGLQRQQSEVVLSLLRCSENQSIAEKSCRDDEQSCCDCCWLGRRFYTLRGCDFLKGRTVDECQVIQENCCLQEQADSAARTRSMSIDFQTTSSNIYSIDSMTGTVSNTISAIQSATLPGLTRTIIGTSMSWISESITTVISDSVTRDGVSQTSAIISSEITATGTTPIESMTGTVSDTISEIQSATLSSTGLTRTITGTPMSFEIMAAQAIITYINRIFTSPTQVIDFILDYIENYFKSVLVTH